MLTDVGKKVLNKMWEHKGATAFNAYFGYDAYSNSRAEGNGIISSAISGASEIAMAAMLPWWAYLGATMAPEVFRFGVNTYDAMDAYGRKLQSQRRNIPFQNATFVDTQQTYTMRQAGMNLARQGQYAAQMTSLGNEAGAIARR